MIIIIYSVCHIFTNLPDWRKALSNGVKTHLFKLKPSKISQGGLCPPPSPPRAAARGFALTGGAVLSFVEKKNDSSEGGGFEMHNLYPCISLSFTLIFYYYIIDLKDKGTSFPDHCNCPQGNLKAWISKHQCNIR